MALGQICTLPKEHLGRHLAQFLERTVTILLKVSLERTEAEYATKASLQNTYLARGVYFWFNLPKCVHVRALKTVVIKTKLFNY